MAAAGELAGLAEILGHEFERPELLLEALTHSSAAPQAVRSRKLGAPARGYERLEFLGDRVLGLVVAELLWRRFPDEPEGALTRRHTQLVRRETVADVAREAGLGLHIRLSLGEGGADIRGNASLLADICEAVIAALYIDGGLAAAGAFIRRYWAARIEAALVPPQDPKTALQEWAQARFDSLPRYETTGIEGPGHQRVFTVSVKVGDEAEATGKGTSKRAAETSAAATLLARVLGSGPA